MNRHRLIIGLFLMLAGLIASIPPVHAATRTGTWNFLSKIAQPFKQATRRLSTRGTTRATKAQVTHKATRTLNSRATHRATRRGTHGLRRRISL